MSLRRENLQNLVNRINEGRGYFNPTTLTVGAYRLMHENGGYCVREVVNVGGGVRTLGHCYGMTTRECYIFLQGLAEGLNV